MTGWAVRWPLKSTVSWLGDCGDMWAMRPADLPGTHGHYYRYMTDGRRFYGTKDKSQASIWKYRATAESFMVRHGIAGEALQVPIYHAGFVTNDGRKSLRAS